MTEEKTTCAFLRSDSSPPYFPHAFELKKAHPMTAIIIRTRTKRREKGPQTDTQHNILIKEGK